MSYDIDGTLLGVDKSRSNAAVKACEAAGYKLALDTAEPPGVCEAWAGWRLESVGLYINKNLPWDMFQCRAHFHKGKSKVTNMVNAMNYYGSNKSCTLLFDDNQDNINAVLGAGF